MSPAHLGGPHDSIVTLRDVTAARRHALETLAYDDPLTGLAHRRLRWRVHRSSVTRSSGVRSSRAG